jgi:hypothetical protein
MADGEFVENLAVFSAGVYRHAQAFRVEDSGKLYFGNPERIPYEDRSDTTLYTCYGGEFLWELCVEFLKDAYPNPADLAEFVANFQPTPIVDWSVPLRAGQKIYIPSVDFLEEVAYGDSLLDVQDL